MYIKTNTAGCELRDLMVEKPVTSIIPLILYIVKKDKKRKKAIETNQEPYHMSK